MKCKMCNERDWQIRISLSAKNYETGRRCNGDYYICCECFCKVFNFITMFHKPEIKGTHKKNIVIPSLPWGKRQKLGKITDNEIIDFHNWIKNINMFKDFNMEE